MVVAVRKRVTTKTNAKECRLEPNSLSSMTASDCCKILSDALDEGFLITRKNNNAGEEIDSSEEEDTSTQQNATSAFVNILSASKHERLAYINIIKSSDFQKRHARRLFSALHVILKLTFEGEHYVPLSAFEEESFENDNIEEERQSIPSNDCDGAPRKRNSSISQFSNCTIAPDPASTEALRFIKYAAIIVQAFLTNQIQRRRVADSGSDKELDLIEEVFLVAELLHENLFALNSCGREGVMAQKEIVAMCEMYWQGRFTDNEVLVTQLLPLLVVKSLNGNATKADVKRLWNMRQSLHLLDFQEQDTISELRNLLLRTVSSPLYLKNVEGQKMIAFLFQLHTSVLKDLHRSIRAQVLFSSPAILEAYGQIYFFAWKGINESDKGSSFEQDISSADNVTSDVNDRVGNSNALQSVFEDCLQDFMSASMHASSPHMTKAILSLLEPLHAQKKNPDVDSLLYRLYNPILWRALSATNPLVRINACTLFHHTFPLHDPNLGNVHLKQVNVKSIEVLLSLLNDDDPKVRVAGCDASVRILGVFWDALSSAHIRSLLNEIIMKHANDASSGTVRCQAVKGITLLLDAKASHGVLRPLLPILGNRLHDSVERVRLATARMLLRLKETKGFKYYHVVPSNHILARLAVEGSDSRKTCGPVASAITELLVNSYFPKGGLGSEQTRRTLHFITQNQEASKVFYANISNHLEINFCCKLIVMLFKTMKKAVDNAVENEQIESTIIDLSTSKESSETRVVTANVDLLAGIAETISTIYNSISEDLLCEDNSECSHFVLNTLNEAEVLHICTYFEDVLLNAPSKETEKRCNRICSSLLSCVNFSSDKSLAQICNVLESRKKRSNEIDLLPYYAVLCSWGKCDDVVLSFTKVLDDFLEIVSEEKKEETNSSCIQAAKKRKRTQSTPPNRNKGNSGIPLIPYKSSVFILEQALHGKSSTSTSIRNSILSSETACAALEKLLLKVNSTVQTILKKGDWQSYSDEDIETVLQTWEVLCKIILHKEARRDHHISITPLIRDHLITIPDFVVSILPELDDENVVTNSPFQDLNLSRISSIGSRNSVLKLPMSPPPLSPQRRESPSYPSSKDSDHSFLDMEKRGSSEFKIKKDLSTSVRKNAICVALLRSVISLCDELILLGLEDCSEIIQLGKTWSQVMNKNTKTDVASPLFPSFCRFVILVGRASCNYGLIVDVIKAFDDSANKKNGKDLLTKSMRTILSYRDKDASKHMQSLISELVNYIPIFTDKMKTSTDDWEEIAREGSGCGLNILFEAIISHGKFVPLLIKLLLESPKPTTDDEIERKLRRDILMRSCRCISKPTIESEIRDVLSNHLADDRTRTDCNSTNGARIEVMLEAILA